MIQHSALGTPNQTSTVPKAYKHYPQLNQVNLLCASMNYDRSSGLQEMYSMTNTWPQDVRGKSNYSMEYLLCAG